MGESAPIVFFPTSSGSWESWRWARANSCSIVSPIRDTRGARSDLENTVPVCVGLDHGEQRGSRAENLPKHPQIVIQRGTIQLDHLQRPLVTHFDRRCLPGKTNRNPRKFALE